ncbi:hypothetical protein Clacol_004268 [Clathrus columnatus]|uniref:Uncharacterized protein n=1 Tax=Clathrus columnatus TaxID=1419009 RepID=A0AAV5A8N6_9AGAM|nr:hypothetical protein Clacol_004268 [Clathrus columnatus]
MTDVRLKKCNEDAVGGISGSTTSKYALLARVSSHEILWECGIMRGSGRRRDHDARSKNSAFPDYMIYYQPTTTRIFFGLFSAAWIPAHHMMLRQKEGNEVLLLTSTERWGAPTVVLFIFAEPTSMLPALSPPEVKLSISVYRPPQSTVNTLTAAESIPTVITQVLIIVLPKVINLKRDLRC